MKRGDIVIVAVQGDYGKPRPAVIVQSDLFNETHASLLLCLISSDLQDAPLFRIPVAPNEANGLHSPSQIMVDKIMAVRRERITQRVGTLDEATLMQLNRSLALFLGIA